MTDPHSPNAKEEFKPNIGDDCAKYDPSNHTPIDINTWISSFMIEIELTEYFNDDLFDVFNEGFVNFNAAQLKRCSDMILRKLKNFLFDRGVFVRKANISHVEAITEVQEKDESIWAFDVTNPSTHIGSYKTNNFQSPRISLSRKNVQNYFNKDDTKGSKSTKIHQTTDARKRFDQRHNSDNPKIHHQFLAEYEGNSDSEINEEAIILDSMRSNTDGEPVGGFFITADSNDEETRCNYMKSSYSTDDDHIHEKISIFTLGNNFGVIREKVFLVKHCELYQKHGPSPRIFKFSLRDNDCCFNQTIYVDVIFIESNPVLHVVDEATRFQAAQFLKGQTTQDIWDALRCSWIDVYVGPPDLIVHDAAKNLTSKETQQYAQSIGTGTKCIPVEAHHSNGIVERYHAPLRRAFNIIIEELRDQKLNKSTILQMAVKAINDTAGPDGITPTLLVFGMYPKITEAHESNLPIIARVKAIQKASANISAFRSNKLINSAINETSGPDTTPLHNLPLGSKVWVWREPGKSTGPYPLLKINNEDCTVQLSSGPTKFRSTSCKPFYNSNQNEINIISDQQNSKITNNLEPNNHKERQNQAQLIEYENSASNTQPKTS
ncbi:hypothetical protein K3495_g906 [Podosphaera aphanis]|nr:hypothetical protein K3495_g906 [Podosphaera aphanis]